jgi:hypothetical protein
MPVYKNLKAIRRLTNSSLTSIIDITNLNFKSLSDANLEFLNNISYNETTNSFSVNRGTFEYVDVTNTLSLLADGVTTFSIDSSGNAEGQSLLVQVAEAKRLRLTDFNDWPTPGVPGEVIYTGIQNQRPQFGEDFIGYLQGRGWVSLTGGMSAGYITLSELAESPPVPACPEAGQAHVWIGPLGYQDSYIPTTQTLYYTDENCNTFDLVTDFIWEKVGDDGKFKLDGKVIIGDSVNPRQFQYVDGNQYAGYVLTSDAYGNASWQPASGGSGGGGAGACSYIYNGSFTANSPLTITHNLGTNNIQIELIKLSTNEQIEGYYDNYQTNTVDVTLSETISNVKVIIISADCNNLGPQGPQGVTGPQGAIGPQGPAGSGGGGADIEILQEDTTVIVAADQINYAGPGVLVTNPSGNKATVTIGTKNYIQSVDVITVTQDYQYFVYGNLTIGGTVNNYGEVVVANGTVIVLPGGQINNIGTGLIKIVNLATGDSMQAVVKTFTAVANTPLTVNHNLGTRDFTYTVREGNIILEVDIEHIDDDNIQLTSTANIASGSIVFHAKI